MIFWLIIILLIQTIQQISVYTEKLNNSIYLPQEEKEKSWNIRYNNLIYQNESNKVDSKVVEIDFDSPVFQSESFELECRFNLDEEKKLYSIKWFKDGEEFFQYMPNDHPKVRYYSSKIITVPPQYEVFDDSFRLLLKNVNLNFQGVYGCELSTDAPEFMTFIDYKPLEVYVLPNKSPRISGNNHRMNFVLKSRIDLNCTSPKSKPVSTLQWFINDQLAPSDYLIFYNQVNHSDGLQSKTVRLKFIVNEDHYQLGRMRLECVAVYRKLSMDRNGTLIEHKSKGSSSQRIPFWRRKEKLQKKNQAGIITKTTGSSVSSLAQNSFVGYVVMFFMVTTMLPINIYQIHRSTFI